MAMCDRQIFLVIFFMFFYFVMSQKCLRPNCNSYEQYLGTKTPYRVVANINSTQIQFPGCNATKFWGLIRHGTRNPNVKLIEKMRDRLPDIRDLLLENLKSATEYIRSSDLDLFRKWSTKLEDKDEKKLTFEGEDEMLQLAERFQERFPSVFDRAYSSSSYNFKYTATQRTRKSAHAFSAGLFGRQTVRDIEFPEPLKRDPILRFYKLCNKWRREVSKNPAAVIERRLFETGKYMKRTIANINQRLGFTDELDLSDVHTMYMVCAFETAWNKRKRSPWCSPFTLEDFKVFEYAEDLKYYWVDGYGHELTYKQACPAFNDFINFFEEKEQLPKVIAYFTHSGTLLKMLAHMELYKEESNLMADEFEKREKRNWRVSDIDAFGTNLAFILFNCDGTPKVLTMHQENIVRLPCCPNSDLCDLKRIGRYYGESIEECTFDEMCDNEL